METKLYRINGMFAHENHIPVYFAANKLKETAKAVYLYGSFTTETTGINVCCGCGRTLTHPVSVVLGIGPECGGHWWDWKLIGGYSMENIERLKMEIGAKMRNLIIDQWFPKRVVLEELPAATTVTTPADHKMLQPVTPALQVNSANKVTSQRKATIGVTQAGERLLKIEFVYNAEDVARMHNLSGNKYHPAFRIWTASLTRDNVEKLKEWGFDLNERLLEWIPPKTTSPDSVVNPDHIPGFRGELFPFQRDGVKFLERKDGSALIADEMGLGKTIQALAYLQLHPELRPAVVVVPASLKRNWEREANRFMTEPGVQVLSGTKTGKITGKIVVINYDILADWVDALLQIHPRIMITDECHYYKNSSAQRTKAVKRLGKFIPKIIALSGTPIVNRPVEVYNALKLIDSTVVPNFFTYAQRYCGARHNGFGWDFNGATNTQELHEKLINTVMIRRMKADVLKDLPDKTRSFIPMELNNQREYNQAESNFIEFIRNRKGNQAALKASNAQALVEIETLKQLAVQGKLPQAIDWMSNFLEVDGKLVVFAVHKFVVDVLMEQFKDIAVKVDGSVPNEQRSINVERFQNDPKIRLFVGNVQAAGVGLTLTAASNVAFLELPWTPGELSQAEDRCHRIGQKDAVNVHYLLAEGTIEEKIARLIDKKRKVLDSVLDGKETEQESLLTEIMNEYDQN